MPKKKESGRFQIDVIENADKSEVFDADDIGLAPQSPVHHTFDTKNLKTFGKNTQERIPRFEFYQNSRSANGFFKSKRPTLAQLRETSGDFPNGVRDEEALLATQAQSEEQLVVTDSETAIAGRFGWIQGVLVRCLLSIFGVMIFLRLSWVTGQAGAGFATLIVLLSNIVTVITTLSMSAICTNGEVKGGGAYYMISRNLGPEFGGAIGIIFSIANAVATALYVIGFAESVVSLMEEADVIVFSPTNDVRMIGVITTTFLLAIALMGMAWEAKAQVVLLVVLLISIVNFIIGTFLPQTEERLSKGIIGYTSAENFASNIGPDYQDGHNLMSIFAVFFPACTGILAGANISGDLKNPSTAIPKGTLLSIGISSSVYIGLIWLLAAIATRGASAVVDIRNGTVIYSACTDPESCIGLLYDYRLMEYAAGFGPIVLAGIFAATLSSALASLVGASKVFQAVFKDNLFPSKLYMFAKGYGADGEPRLSYLLTYIVSIAFVLIGDLNTVAPIISNFFLMSYTLINYSCFQASFSEVPGWRPTFRFYSKWVSLLGGLLCLVVMLLITWWAALITFILIVGLYMYILKRNPDVNWGSSAQAVVYKETLQHVFKLARTKEHVKTFRFQILVLSGTPSKRPTLVDFANNITMGESLMVCADAHVEETVESKPFQPPNTSEVNDFLHEKGVQGFYTFLSSPTLRGGARGLMQCTGLGKLKPNICLLGFKRDWSTCDPAAVVEYVNIIHDAFDLNLCVSILRVDGPLDVSEFVSEDAVYSEVARRVEVEARLAEQNSANHNRRESECEPGTDGEDGVVSERKRTTSVTLTSPPMSARSFAKNNIYETLLTGGGRRGRKGKAMDAQCTQLLKVIGLYSKQQKAGTIDVWWLFDDGGLTLLLPYILSRRPMWKKTSLRIFMPGTKASDLDKEQAKLVKLLRKFRIDCSSIEVLPSFGKPPQPATKRFFEGCMTQWEDRKDTPGFQPVTEEDREAHSERTARHLRVRELLLEKSAEATLIVVTLPVPKKGCPSGLYMSWLEALTKDMPAPTLLLRGNQEPVLTFYS